MQDRERLARHIEDCLSNFYDTARLQTSCLKELLALPDGDQDTTARQLRDVLRSAIEMLRPESAAPFDAPEWLGYRVLQTRYIHNLSEVQTCQELGISRSTYYRRRREALSAVCSILWQQRRTGKPPLAAGPGVDGKQAPGAPLAREASELTLSSRLEWVDMDAVLAQVRGTIGPLVAQRGIEVVMDVARPLPPLRYDATLLHQMLTSVLAEGIERVAGDRLTLSVTSAEGATLWELRPLLLSPTAPPDPQSGPFALLRALLDLHGQQPAVDADPSGHAALRFTLPSAKPLTVLIIDNDADMTRLYSLYLHEGGYGACEAHDREEMEALLSEATPDLVLLDILMPQFGGWGLLQRLRSDPRTARVPVIVCSVLSHADLALALGANDVLQKPISDQTLLQAVGRALGPQDSSA